MLLGAVRFLSTMKFETHPAIWSMLIATSLLPIILSIIHMKTKDNFTLTIALYVLEIRLFLGMAVPIDFKSELYPKDISNTIAISFAILLNLSFQLSNMPHYKLLQLAIVSLLMVIMIAYRMLGDQWTSRFINVVLYFIPCFMFQMLYLCITKLMLEYKIKEVIDWQRSLQAKETHKNMQEIYLKTFQALNEPIITVS